MPGFDESNSIVDTTTGEEENFSVDASDSSVDDTNAADDPFLDGLGVSEAGDGSAEATSNPSENAKESDKPQEKSEDEQSKSDVPDNSSSKSGGRPDKRQRQINDLLAMNAQKDRELAELRQKQLEATRNELPKGDDDGNITVEQMAEYSQKLAEDAARRQLAEFERRTLTAEDKRHQTEALAEVERIVADARSKYKVLNKADQASYKPKVDARMLERVKDAISPFMVAGSRDYQAVVETVKATIDKEMEFYNEIELEGAAKARKNLDLLRDSSALVSQDAGGSSEADDDSFLTGFNS